LESSTSVDISPESFINVIHLLYAGVADAGHYDVLQETGIMDMAIQFSEINTHTSPISEGNECMEIHKKTDSWELKKEESLERKLHVCHVLVCLATGP
jgi:hypothetical protein